VGERLLQGALTVARTLRAAGFEAYYAGGCVRDKQLGIMPKDYDIVTDALPAQVGGLFKRSVMVGAAFGVVKVIIGRGLEYEIATYRHDGEYLDGRRPDRVTYSSDKDEDVHRRDFTINALLMDPETSEVIDLVDGLADLEAKLIRTVGDPEQRFAEDRLRMLRAVRFAARYDFAIHGDTADAIRLHASEIGDVSVERIVHEVHGIWDSKHPDLGAALLHSTGLTPAVFDFLSGHDEVEARMGRLGSKVAHLPEEQRHAVGWAATLELYDGDAEAILRRFKLSRTLIRNVLAILKHPTLRAPSAARLADQLRVVIDPQRAMLLAYLDAIGAGDLRSTYEGLVAAVERDPLPTLPLIGGKDLAALGMTPGPEFKVILREVETETLERRVKTKDEALEWVRSTHVDPSS